MHTKIGTNTGQNIEVNCTLKHDRDEIFNRSVFESLRCSIYFPRGLLKLKLYSLFRYTTNRPEK